MIIDMAREQIKRMRYKAGLSEIEIEILVSFFACLERFADVDIDTISGVESTKEIFNGSNKNMEIVFCSMVEHWNLIDALNEEDIPEGNEFKKYPQISDLYHFFCEKYQNKQKIEA